MAPDDVLRVALGNRAEITAAKARAYAGEQRPRQVSALPDPMLMVTADHIPFSLAGVNGSVTVQQEFPLSGVLGKRRRVAEADVERLRADAARVTQDVQYEALMAYFELAGRRDTRVVVEDQVAIVRAIVAVARAHYSSGQVQLAEVMRLENELARLTSEKTALVPEIRGSEAALATTLGLPADMEVPPLDWHHDPGEPPSLVEAMQIALATRPEVRSVRAERARAEADTEVARAAYTPVALLRAGPAYSMQEGAGVMVMVGVSLPIWRDRLSGGVEEANAMASSAKAELTALERIVVREIATAREQVIAERSRLDAIEREILPRSRSVVSAALASFGTGQIQLLVVLDSTRDLRQVQMEQVVAKVRLHLASAKLRRAMGWPRRLPTTRRLRSGASRWNEPIQNEKAYEHDLPTRSPRVGRRRRG